MAKTYLTGIKPTGTPHIGNYFGVIKPAIELSAQNEGNFYYFIADYHALTTLQNAEDLKRLTYEVAATWLACGLDTSKVVFYKQSEIKEIFELFWILSNVTPKGLMNRAHAYKAINEKNKQLNQEEDFGINMGLYNYPVLMSADILLLNSNYVPVGLDQKQHVEIARDIAQTFNKKYGKSLVVPEPLIDENVCTIPGLDGRKMSKSYNNVIPLFCDEQTLKKTISRIVTDSTPPNEPKDTNSYIFQIYKLFASEKEIAEMREKFNKGISWAEAKNMVFEKANNYLTPLREKYNYYITHTEEIDKLLFEGANKVKIIAKQTMERVRKAIGQN